MYCFRCGETRGGAHASCYVEATVEEKVKTVEEAGGDYVIRVRVAVCAYVTGEREVHDAEIGCMGLLGDISEALNVHPCPIFPEDIVVPATPANFTILSYMFDVGRAGVSARMVPASTASFFSASVLCFVPKPSHYGLVLAGIPSRLRNALLDFQIKGVLFGLAREGRVLIADEMGTGKTVQALALAACYRTDWPVLVVTPAAVRSMWAEQIEQWLGEWLLPSDIHVICASNDQLYDSTKALRPKVTIVSYHMLHRLRTSIGSWKWGVVICDESHHIFTAQKDGTENGITLVTLDVVSSARRAILLSGTPSLNRPFQLFNQVNALRKGLLGGKRFHFASSYCRGTQRFIKLGSHLVAQVRCGGITHSGELNALLRRAVMIRRLKKDVMLQLPPLWRTVIRLQPNMREIKEGEKARESADAKGAMSQYQRDGLLKVPEAQEWVSAKVMDSPDSQGSGIKLVMFAHHRTVMDALQRSFELDPHFRRSGCKPVLRIDGSVSQKMRLDRLRAFKEQPATCIMLVSTMAGGEGIDISFASAAVFVELPPQVHHLRQAEDRLHRRGQKSGVHVFYMVLSPGSHDEDRWFNMSSKLYNVTSAINTDLRPESLYVDNFNCEGVLQDREDGGDFGCMNGSEQDCEVSSGNERNIVASGVEDGHTNVLQLEGLTLQSVADKNMIQLQNSTSFFAKSDTSSEDERIKGDNSPSFFFEVSRHTGRLHLHRSLDGGKPKGNFSVGSLLRVVNSATREVLQQELPREMRRSTEAIRLACQFVDDFRALRPRERARLIGRILAPPLEESIRGLSHALPGTTSRYARLLDGVTVAHVNFKGLHRTRIITIRQRQIKSYVQRISCGAALCIGCNVGDAGVGANGEPEQFRDLFCSKECYESYSSKKSGSILRQVVRNRDGGVCDFCKVDCVALFERLLSLSTRGDRKRLLDEIDSRWWKDCRRQASHLITAPREGLVWEADHVVGVAEGGGACDSDNVRTLCVPCHLQRSKKQATNRAK